MPLGMETKNIIKKTDLKVIMENVYLDQQKRFIQKLPSRPYCAEKITDGLIIEDLDKAICYPYIQLNRHDRGYIVLDLDIKNSAYLWQDLELPEPTIICVNPKTTHCHYFYELKIGVKHPKTNEGYSPYSMKAIKYFESVYKTLVLKYKADPSYGQLIAKNPLHPHWLTIWTNVSYELSDFRKYLKITWNFKNYTPRDQQILGRNDYIFNVVREMVKDFLTSSSTFEEIYEYTHMSVSVENSKFDEPLPASEVRSITNSISKYSFKNKELIIQRRQEQKSLILTNEEIKEKQKIAANKTNKSQSENTRSIILNTIAKFKQENKKITIAALAKEMNKNRSWITTRYSDFIKSQI